MQESVSIIAINVCAHVFSELEQRQLRILRVSTSAASDGYKRQEWLRRFVPGTHVDYSVEKMLVSDFIHKELILFSMADNVRSIPSLVDGLKPAQRKVLFACFKRGLRADIKVAQLAGYVSEHAAYHHGEAALAATIVGMAQDFVGSNNVNLLVPSGQFGTRLMGGKDAASARYIFTRLSPLARACLATASLLQLPQLVSLLLLLLLRPRPLPPYRPPSPFPVFGLSPIQISEPTRPH